MKESEKPDICKVYGCDEDPLSYMIESKGSIEIVDKDDVTKKEDLENIL